MMSKVYKKKKKKTEIKISERYTKIKKAKKSAKGKFSRKKISFFGGDFVKLCYNKIATS